MTANDERNGARLYYLDWPRIWATFILIPYHTARIFDCVPWYIKNESYGVFFEALNRFVEIWHMPPTGRGAQVLSNWAGVISRKKAMILLVACLLALARLTGLPYPDPLYFFLFRVWGRGQKAPRRPT